MYDPYTDMIENYIKFWLNTSFKYRIYCCKTY